MRKGAEVTWLCHSVAAVSKLQHDTPGILHHPVRIVLTQSDIATFSKSLKTSEDVCILSCVCAQTEIARAETARKKAIKFYWVFAKIFAMYESLKITRSVCRPASGFVYRNCTVGGWSELYPPYHEACAFSDDGESETEV